MFARRPVIPLMVGGILLAGAIALLPAEDSGALQQRVLRAALGHAQNENAGNNPSYLQSPTLGYVAQSSPAEIRPILGIPGAAVFGDRVTIPRNVTQLYVAPGNSYAFAERQGASDIALIQLNGSESSELVEKIGRANV